ncbi:hypothetical protein ABIB50_004347 [Mucilaginibacter sp. UYCu711]
MRHAVRLLQKVNGKCFSPKIGFNPYGVLSPLAVNFFTVIIKNKQQVLQS